jgi:glycosyltransferase involved in cell wall biosynthesis
MRDLGQVDQTEAVPPVEFGAGHLRIALFSGNYNCVRDGANNALNRLAGFLIASGASVRIYSPTIAAPAFDPVGDLVSVPSVPIPKRSEYRLAVGLTKRIRQDIEAFRPTHFHISAPDLQGYQAEKFGRKLGVPIITSLHTRFETYFEYYGLRAIRPRVESYLRDFYARSDLVLVPNRQIQDEMAAWHMGNAISIWSRGVDRAQFNPGRRSEDWRMAHGWSEDDVIPLFFGRLVREKGIGEFAKIIRRAREQGLNIRPLVIGDGPAKLELARELPGGAYFVGHLSGPDLWTAVASADVLINPSTTEAFGNVNLEAMASGVPVISANVASAQALIANNDNGVLVEPHNVDGYVERLSELVASPPRRAAIGIAAALSATAFSWTQVLADVLTAYTDLL